jgi:uncharacterized membrane protein YedE/YeeE
MRPLFLPAAFASGLLFGTGLVLSGMTDPANIMAFLDVAGAWNPALAVVMGSAIAVAAPAFLLVKRRRRTLLGEPADIANHRPVDLPLLLGSAIFGVGWGLSGICPGPGLMLAASGNGGALVFVAAMTAGMLVSPWLGRQGLNGGDDKASPPAGVRVG